MSVDKVTISNFFSFLNTPVFVATSNTGSWSMILILVFERHYNVQIFQLHVLGVAIHFCYKTLKLWMVTIVMVVRTKYYSCSNVLKSKYCVLRNYIQILLQYFILIKMLVIFCVFSSLRRKISSKCRGTLNLSVCQSSPSSTRVPIVLLQVSDFLP